MEDVDVKSTMYSEKPHKYFSQVFSNFFNSYSKSFNLVHKRRGRLFLYPFKRIVVDNDKYLTYLICYIHRNPIHHGLTKSYSKWKYSSFNFILLSSNPDKKKEFVISLFGTKEEFLIFHEENRKTYRLEDYLIE